jgi:hypothetical protein
MTTVMKPIISKTEQIYVKELLEVIDSIVADYQFQSKARWTDRERQNFVESMLVNMAPSKFIFADTISCGQTAPTSEDKKYFESHSSKDVVYLNIDSNNRVTTIKLFVEDAFALKPGAYEINGTIYKVKKGENDTYSTMSTALRIAFETSIITIERVTTATRSQLSELFIRLNDGKPLNKPEKRNAIISEVANTIRGLANSYETSVSDSKLFTDNDFTRRKFDEFIGSCAILFFGGRNASMTDTVYDKMYDATSEYQNSIKSFATRFKDFMTLVGENAPDLGMRNALLDLFVFYNEIRSEGYTINKENYNAFVDAYKSALVAALSDKTDIEYEADRKSTFEGLLRNKKYIKYRMDVITAKGFEPETFGVKLDSTRTASKTTRMIAAERDGYKTYEGKEIQRGRLLTSDYEAGHKTPYSVGGDAGVDNTVMQTREDNRKTGTTPLV